MFGLILGIGCVSAADDDVSVGDTSLSVSNNSCNATNFRELSDFIKTHDIVELENDIIRQDGEGDISFTKDVTIDGKGHTINANKKGRIFNVVRNTLTLNNLKLINGNADKEGGVINCNNLVCTNCSFINNYASWNGGAILCVNIIAQSCEFINNSVYDGSENKGGAIYIKTNKESIIINSTFVNNRAGGNGGAICSSNSLTVQFSDFRNNYVSKKYGGAIYVEELFKSLNNSFISNTAYVGGGAVSTSSAIIINSIFDSNFANDDNGGAIHASFYVDCTNSTFTYNHAFIDGGAIYSLKDKVTVNSCIFDSNVANGAKSQCYGGAICSREVLECKNSNFTNNYAYDYGGALYSYNNIKLTNCLFENNEAHDNKGGAVFSDKNVECTGSIFINNHAEEYGGAIYCAVSDKIKDSTFINNSAKKRGGAITIWNNCVTTIQDSKFMNNSASEGGAIYTDSKNHNLYIHHNIFINNSMDVYGSGYFKQIDHNYFGTPNPDFYGNPGIFVEWKHWPKDDIKHADSTYFKTLEDYEAYGNGMDRVDIDTEDNSSLDNNDSDVSSDSDDVGNEGIPMEHAGFPLIAILLAIFVLPIVRFKK